METRPTLLERIKDSADGLAWGEFVDCYTPLVFRFLRGRGLQEADAADVCQEVMQVVAQAMPEFHYDPERGTFRSWLYTITRRRLFRHLGKRRESSEEALTEEGVDGGFREAWDQEWRQHLLDRAMARVKAQFGARPWEIFWRTTVLEENPAEVAQATGMTREAVYMARSRVTARMREVLNELGDEE